MKIAMLARNANLYSHQRLKQAAEERGHHFEILNTLRCTVHIASHRPEVFYNGEPMLGYDAVIPRIGASITNYGLAILRQFEMRGCWPLNESVAIGRSRDKLRSMQILAKHGLGLPLTAYANDPKQAEEIIRAVKGPPVVIKLLEGTQGIGVVLAETDEQREIGDRGLPRRQCEHPGAGIHQGSRRHRHPRAGDRRQGRRSDEAHRRAR